MNKNIYKSIVATIVSAAFILLAGCGGGGSSSSSGGASFSAGTTVVKGNITDLGGAQAMLTPGSPSDRLAMTFSDFLIGQAHAQSSLEGVDVCVQLICDTTDINGAFTLDLSGLVSGPYEITFEYNGVMFSETLDVKNNAITTLSGVLLEDGGRVKITNITVVVMQNEDDDSDDDDSEGSSPAKIVVCHRPGTPAQQNLVVSESALKGHLGHGDSEGACDIDFGDAPEPVEQPGEEG